MLIFFFSSGQGGTWSVGPLILALLPLLLQLAPALLQGTSSTGFWTQLPTAEDAIRLVGAITLFAVGVICFVRWVRRNGGWRFLLQLLLHGYQGGPAGGAAGVQGQGGQGRAAQHGRTQARVTLEQVTEALMKLPTEPYMTPEQLAALSVHDIKELIRGRGLECVKCLEKGELVRQLLEHGGSSAHSCSICCEDYAASPDAGKVFGSGGDTGAAGGGGGAADTDELPIVLRVLRCGHRFHVECVDKWFLSATDYTREPACPLCNAPLLQPQAAGMKRGAGRQ